MKGLFIKDLPPGYALQVRTGTDIYTITYCGEAWGGRWDGCKFHGSTFGGSMIRLGWVGIGMFLEFGSSKRHASGLAALLTSNSVLDFDVVRLIKPSFDDDLSA